MTRATELFGKRTTNAYSKADKTNRSGHTAFSGSLESDTLSVLITNTLGNTYYASAKELVGETLDVLKAMAEKDATFLAKAIVYARNVGLMRLAPIVGLVVLSAHESSEAKHAFKNIFPKVIRTPDDLREFVSICRSKAIRQGLGGVARDAVKLWLTKMTEYHAVKYGSANSKDMTLRDILRMAHPIPSDPTQANMFKWLVKGADELKKKDFTKLKMITALSNLKKTDDEEEAIKIIEDGKLPWEVVVPTVPKMTTKIWAKLMKNMPYMALLRNLATLERHDVFKTKKNVDYVAGTLSDPDHVRKSKQLPFRFFNAYKTYEGEQKITDAIVEALEASSENLPEIDGTVCIANDVSGSMGSHINEKSTTTLQDIAAIMGATLIKKNQDGKIICTPFDDKLYHPKLNRKDSVITNSEKLHGNGGGTTLELPVKELLKNKTKVDVLILITDMEENGSGFLTVWNKYKREVNPKAKVFFCNIAPYRDYPTHTNEKDVFYIHGWSDAVLRYIATAVKGDGQLDAVNAIDLYEKENTSDDAGE